MFAKIQVIATKILVSIGLFLLLPGLVLSPNVDAASDTAYDPCTVFGNCLSGTPSYQNQSANNIVVGLVLGFSYFLIYVGGAVAVFYIVIGGYRMVSANGDDSTYKAGRSMVSNAIIGLVLIIISVTIVRLVTVLVTGLQIPNLFG